MSETEIQKKQDQRPPLPTYNEIAVIAQLISETGKDGLIRCTRKELAQKIAGNGDFDDPRLRTVYYNTVIVLHRLEKDGIIGRSDRFGQSDTVKVRPRAGRNYFYRILDWMALARRIDDLPPSVLNLRAMRDEAVHRLKEQDSDNALHSA